MQRGSRKIRMIKTRSHKSVEIIIRHNIIEIVNKNHMKARKGAIKEFIKCEFKKKMHKHVLKK